VEVAFIDHVVAVRDSNDPTGSMLFFDRKSWAAFVATVRDEDG